MAAYNIEEIKRLSNLLAANVRLKLEYSSFANKTKKLLLVEGSTDVMFISHIKTNIIFCSFIKRIFYILY